jgi:hypothetical protein
MKNTGKADRSAGTAGLQASAAVGMKAIRMLRPIMRLHLQFAPALRAAWNLAARVERPAKKAPPATTGTVDPVGAALGKEIHPETSIGAAMRSENPRCPTSLPSSGRDGQFANPAAAREPFA